MLWPQVDEDTFEYMVEQVFGGRCLIEGVVDVVEDLELVGGLAQLLGAGLRRSGELALRLGNDLAGGAEDGVAFCVGALVGLGAPASTEGNA